MALDTRGFMDGFTKGYGMMDNHFSRQAERKLQEQQAEMNKQKMEFDKEKFSHKVNAWESENEWNEKVRGRQEDEWKSADDSEAIQNVVNLMESHGAESIGQDEINQLSQVDQSRLPPELRKMVASHNSQNQILTQAQQMQERLKERQVQAAENIMTGTGELNDEDIKDAPSGLFIAGTPEMEQALYSIDEQFEKLKSGGAMEATPEFLGALNTLYDNKIGEGKRIVGIYPGKQQGTVAFELEVNDGSGNLRRAPMTVNRGTEEDGDNEIRQVPVERLIDSLQGARTLHEAFKSNPDAQQRVKRWAVQNGYITPQERWVSAGTNAAGQTIIQNTATGEIKAVGSAPAAGIQEMQFGLNAGQPIYGQEADPVTGQRFNINRITGRRESTGSTQSSEMQQINAAGAMGVPLYDNPKQQGRGLTQRNNLTNEINRKDPPNRNNEDPSQSVKHVTSALESYMSSVNSIKSTDPTGFPRNPQDLANEQRQAFAHAAQSAFVDLPPEAAQTAFSMIYEILATQGDIKPEDIAGTRRAALQDLMEERERNQESTTEAPPEKPKPEHQGSTYGDIKSGIMGLFGTQGNQQQYGRFDPRNIPDA